MLQKEIISKLEDLSKKILNQIIESASLSGGHIGSSLGVTKMTVMLNEVFDFDKDIIIWDIGHQSYAYKYLTGKDISKIRQDNGIAPFSYIHESKYDHFGGGHSSVAISGALGIYETLQDKEIKIISIIGDGAMSAGIAFEAMNNIPENAGNMIFILNDNGMSISKGVGNFQNILLSQEKSKAFFNCFNMEYIGIIDGDNFEDMYNVFDKCKSKKNIDQATLIHIKTYKGFSMKNRELHETQYHSIAKKSFQSSSPITYQQYISDLLLKHRKNLSKKNQLKVITPAMSVGSLLQNHFNEFPSDTFDVGIAEQHAITFAAGIAVKGGLPCVFIYSTFLQRGYDQLIHDIICQSLNVKFFIDRAGLSGHDGHTHHGIYDIIMSYYLHNIDIYSPYYKEDVQFAFNDMFNKDHTCFLRYPKNELPSLDESLYMDISSDMYEICLNQDSNTIHDACIITYGTSMQQAIQAANLYGNEFNKKVSIINLVKITNIDSSKIKNLTNKFNRIIIVDESVGGCVCYSVEDILNDKKIYKLYIKNGIILHDTISKQRKNALISHEEIISLLR